MSSARSHARSQKLARWIFILAAIYGIPVLGSWFFNTHGGIGYRRRFAILFRAWRLSLRI